MELLEVVDVVVEAEGSQEVIIVVKEAKMITTDKSQAISMIKDLMARSSHHQSTKKILDPLLMTRKVRIAKEKSFRKEDSKEVRVMRANKIKTKMKISTTITITITTTTIKTNRII